MIFGCGTEKSIPVVAPLNGMAVLRPGALYENISVRVPTFRFEVTETLRVPRIPAAILQKVDVSDAQMEDSQLVPPKREMTDLLTVPNILPYIVNVTLPSGGLFTGKTMLIEGISYEK